MNINDKIYIAGHNGMVGSAIVRKLKQLGFNNLISRTRMELDLTNQAQVANFFAVEKPEYVFLAAAKVGGINANNKYRADFIYENLQIQNNIIHSSYLNDVKKLLFLGSSCIYPKNAPQPLKEEYLLTGELEYTNEPYAIAKIAGIKMCESYNLQYGTNYIAVMPTNLYGENDNFDLENSHVIPAMIRKMYLSRLLYDECYDELFTTLNVMNRDKDTLEKLLNKYGIYKNNNEIILKLWGTGEVFREFLHVDDMAEACIFVMDKINFKDVMQNPIRNTHINIGTGNDIKLKDAAHLIADVVGYKGIIRFDYSMPDGTIRKLQDVDKINSMGWKYKINFYDGLCKVFDWYLEKYHVMAK